MFIRFGMAFWLASYRDGVWRQRDGPRRFHHKLPVPPWFVERLDECAGTKISQDVLERVRTHTTQIHADALAVRCLVKLTHRPQDDYYRSWRTQFSKEANLLLDYIGGQPADAYSLSVSELRVCQHEEILDCCFGREQHGVARRVFHDASHYTAKVERLTPGAKRLSIGVWNDFAGVTPMRCAADKGKWYWHHEHRQAVAQDHDVAMLSSDSNDSIGGDGGFISDSETDVVDGSGHPECAADVLRAWGITDTTADNVPVLLLPEPIVYLIINKQWQHLVLLTRWHATLINGYGQSLYTNKVFPTESYWDNVEMLLGEMTI